MAKETITVNGVELQTYRFENDVDKKIYYEIYTSKRDTKLFINESLKTGKILKISLWIDGYNIRLSEKYDYGYALHIFTDLINKLKK